MPSTDTLRLEAVSSCPVCATAGRKLLYAGLTDRVFGCAPGEWTLYRCAACGSAFLDPRPTRDTMHLAYRRYFTHDRAAWAQGPRVGRFARARRAISNGYLNSRYGSDFRPALSIGRWVVPLVAHKRARLDGFARHLTRSAAGGTLLDVGCGNGEFLDFARRAGWRVTGLEPDPRAAQVARAGGGEVDVREGGIEVLGEVRAAFDVITLSHVLEHVHEPLELLRACGRLLKPGGCVWIETPNVDSRGHARYRRDWRGLEPPRHLVLFTHASLTAALRAAGFDRIEPQTPRPVCAEIFAASEQAGKLSLTSRVAALWADVLGRVALDRREFLTVKAYIC